VKRKRAWERGGNQSVDREVVAVSRGINLLIVRRVLIQTKFTELTQKTQYFLTQPTSVITLLMTDGAGTLVRYHIKALQARDAFPPISTL